MGHSVLSRAKNENEAGANCVQFSKQQLLTHSPIDCVDAIDPTSVHKPAVTSSEALNGSY